MMNDDLVQRLMELSEPRQDKCDGCPWEEEYPDCTGCICKTTKEAAKAILEMQEIIKKQRDLLMAYGGETGLQRLKEYADKYWALLEQHRWISVGERMPQKEDVYIVALNEVESDFCMWSNEHGFGWIHNGEFCANDEVTHWMPRPKPPKEDK